MILLFEGSEKEKKGIRRLANSLRVTVKEVKRSDYGQTLGFLCGSSGFARSAPLRQPEALEQEMLVFSGLTNEQLDRFLEAYKASALPAIPLKAVVTLTNLKWTPLQLYAELKKEDRSMHQNNL